MTQSTGRFFVNIEQSNAVQTVPVNEPGRIGNSAQAPRTKRVVTIASVALVVAGLLIYGWQTRVRAADIVRAETNDLAVPSVMVTHPQLESNQQEVVLPATVQPFINAPIYAQVTGYLKNWYVDIGGHVSKGQLLAVIAAPTVDQQLQQARGNLATAEANLRLSEITANRYTGLLKSDSVSQEATDTAVGGYQANKATVAADEASVKTLEAQQAFEKVYAPFDGVITARNTDIGQLIDAGANGGPATELFVVSAIRTLRVYVDVPQIYSSLVRRGMTVDLTLPQFPHRRFAGTLVRTADAIDPGSRTLLVEVDVNNTTGLLLPGDYAEAHFALGAASRVYTLPDTALIFRAHGLQVATVDSKGTAKLNNIQVGRDSGTTIEVISGVSSSDRVIVNPPDSLVSGEAVQPVAASEQGGVS
jgi:RND family efflux transporter MFP subunit